MAKINYVQLDEDEYFPKAEKIKKKPGSENIALINKPKHKIKKPVKRTN
jgi:hypothetical protein